MSDKSRTPVIVAAARTPIGKFLGSLSTLTAPQLGAAAIKAAMERAGIPASDVDEVIMGNVVQGGVGQAPARQAMLAAGIPASVSALTVNMVCGSGLKAVMLAAQSIKAGDAKVIVAGGQESMSNAPYYTYGMRGGVKLGDQKMVDGMIKDGLWCASCDVHMGGHAEYTAKKANTTRKEQDEFAASSHRKAVAAQSIKAGDANVIVAGGQESMSNAPYYTYGMRGGVKLGDQKMVDGMIKDGLWCASCDVHMGGHAEYTARKANVTRKQQDDFAASSHRKAVAAQQAGKFKGEIAPVTIPGKKGDTVVDTDEGPRADTTADALAKLRPAFGKGDDATVTAGNASSLNDGGAAVVVTSLEYAEAHGLKVLGKIEAYATGAVNPQDLFFAPIAAVNNLMKKQGKTIGDYDLIEANEAFASQALANGAGLDWDWNRVNVNGGAIALGHPIGASGARVLTTLLYALQDRALHSGLATLCLGGGDAVALSVSR